MLAKVISCGLVGIKGFEVSIEVDISNGLSANDVVGLADTSIKEARDRVRSAIENSGYYFPNGKILTNFAPADVKKEGAYYDLPMAVGILSAGGLIDCNLLKDYVVLGELSLNGEVREVNGVLPLVISAIENGKTKFILPKGNEKEAAYIEKAEVFTVENLRQAVDFLMGKIEIEKATLCNTGQEDVFYEYDFKYVKGQLATKRAIEIAVSGGHNIIMIGPPGAGKTMIAKSIPSIMPEMSYKEILEVTKIHSVAGVLNKKDGVVQKRPFRTPHHTATTIALTGGGKNAKPGEISLGHNGVLFLDEMPEYSRHSLETLRQPLEDGVITIARALLTVEYPARFMLVASMNPCPCGNYGSKDKTCKCTSSQIKKYLSKLSGPLLDRIDIHVEVDAITYDDMKSQKEEESSFEIRKRVNNARQIQRLRFKSDNIECNDQMTSSHLKKHCILSDSCESLLKIAFEKMNLSARAYNRILKVARTIADLDQKLQIEPKHLSEAIQYRMLDRKYWNVL